MLLLDPKAPGAPLRRRLRVRGQCGGHGRKMVRDVRIAVAFYAGEGRISLLRGAVSRCMVQAIGPRSVRQASGSTGRSRASPTGLGGELPAELRGSCGAGRR